MKHLPDDELIRLVQHGDITAFETFVRRYEKRLLSYAYTILRNEFDAQEAVQDALFNFYIAIVRVDTTKKISSYIFEITKNKAISKLRQKKIEYSLKDFEHIQEDLEIFEYLYTSHAKSGLL